MHPNKMKTIFSNIVIFIPLFMLCALAIGYILVLLIAPLALERLQFLIGLDAAVATTAGLSLYASYASYDDRKKASYYQAGEKLFHAFVFIFIATFIRSSSMLLDDFSWYAALKTPIQLLLTFCTMIFFILGITRMIAGLKTLLDFMLLGKQGTAQSERTRL